MASDWRCCVPSCNATREENISLHKFPNPDKDENRFKKWLYLIGGNLLVLDNHYVYKNARVCHKHFEAKYHTWSARLTIDAVPTLLLRVSRRPLSDISNITSNNPTLSEPSTSKGSTQSTEPMPIKDFDHLMSVEPSTSTDLKYDTLLKNKTSIPKLASKNLLQGQAAAARNKKVRAPCGRGSVK